MDNKLDISFDSLRAMSARATEETVLRNEAAAKSLLPNIVLAMKNAAADGKLKCEILFEASKLPIYAIVARMLRESGATSADVDEGKRDWLPTVGGTGSIYSEYCHNTTPKLIISWEKSDLHQ